MIADIVVFVSQMIAQGEENTFIVAQLRRYCKKKKKTSGKVRIVFRVASLLSSPGGNRVTKIEEKKNHHAGGCVVVNNLISLDDCSE